MKTVRYLCGMGASEGPGIQAGDIRSVPDDEAERLIERDLAVPHSTAASKKAASAEKATSRKKSSTAASKKAASAEKAEG